MADKNMPPLLKCEGCEEVVRWFGRWPSFHDAEILSVRIERGATSSIRIRNWNVTERVDESGRFTREREAVVIFEFTGMRWLSLEGEDADVQNVVAGIVVTEDQDGYALEFSPSYGLGGRLVVRELTVSLEK